MAFLTDQILATGVTLDDLIHIVITGDTSQNPDGSSYKATIGQVLSNTYGKIGISDSNGTYTYYTDLTSAISSSVVGDTIIFFTDVVETNPTTCVLPDGVDINLNGYSYTLDNTSTDNAIETNSSTNNIYNGRIIRTNNGAPSSTSGVALRVVSSRINLFGVEVINDSNSTALYVDDSTIKGNYTISSVGSTTPAVYVGTDSNLNYGIIQNLSGYGIEIIGAIELYFCRIYSANHSIFASVPSGSVTLINTQLFSIFENNINLDTASVGIYNSNLTTPSGKNINIITDGALKILNSNLTAVVDVNVFLASSTFGSASEITNSYFYSFFAGGNIRMLSNSSSIYITNNYFYNFNTSGAGGIRMISNSAELIEITNNYFNSVSTSFASTTKTIFIDRNSISDIFITNNRVFTAAPILSARCLDSNTIGIPIYYADNIFSNTNSQSPIGVNVVQANINTPDLYGNIQIP